MVCNTPRRNLKYTSYIFVLCWACPLGISVYHSLTGYGPSIIYTTYIVQIVKFITLIPIYGNKGECYLTLLLVNGL